MSLGIVQVANYLMPLITMPYVSRIIGVENFGLINFSSVFISYFILLVNLGLDMYSVREYISFENDRYKKCELFSNIFYLKTLLTIICSIFFLVFVLFVPFFFKNLHLHLLSFVIILSLPFTCNWIYQSNEKLSYVAYVNLVVKIVFAISILFFIQKSQDYIYFNFIVGIFSIFSSLWLFVNAFNKYKFYFTPVKIRNLIFIITDSFNFFISNLALHFYVSSSPFILGLLKSSISVGFFSAALKFEAIFYTFVLNVFGQAFFPHILKSFRTSKVEGFNTIRRILYIVMPSIVVIIGFVFLLSPYIISIFFGKDFSDSSLTLKIFSLSWIATILNNILGINTMTPLGFEKQYTKILLISILFGLSITFSFTYFYDFNGTALGILLTEYLVLTLILVFFFRNKINIFNR